MKKIFVFSHYDLDGVVCTLLAKWFHPNCDVRYRAFAAFDFRKELTTWMLYNNFEDYETVYILDLDVLEHVDLIDKKNVVIIDHHKKLEERTQFKNATVIVKEYSSACKLAYKVFKKLYDIDLTSEQKQMVLIADDYDCYKLELPLSRALNAIFWGTNKAFESFLEIFNDGFKGLTEHQETIYKLHLLEVKEIIKDLNYFECDYELNNQKIHIVGAMADKHINDIAEHIVKKFSPDVVIVVNMKSNHVSFRRRFDCTFDVSKLAEKLCAGGGHEYSAGGTVEEKAFLEFTKLLKPIKNEH